MLDRNGKEIRTGMIVRVSGAYFKNDNGTYYVDHSPGDPGWCGSDYSLYKIKRNGEPSTAKYRCSFWPLVSFTTNREKNAAAHEHNKLNATIEIIDTIPTDGVKKIFEERVRAEEEHYKWICWNWGENSSELPKTQKLIDHYKAVADRL